MNVILPLEAVNSQHRRLVGGKGYSLAVLKRHGFKVPRTWCITTAAYSQFVSATGIKPHLLMELNRKKFKDLRWEELWDAALRIRSLFTSISSSCNPSSREGVLRYSYIMVGSSDL